MKPIYEVLPGWNEDITADHEYERVARQGQGLHQIPRSDDGRHHLGGGRGPGPRTIRSTLVSRCVVIGSGAREHALAWALAKSADVIVTPGNPGIAAHGISCVDTPATEFDADLFVIGPDQQVVDGLADDLRAQGKTGLRAGRRRRAARRFEGVLEGVPRERERPERGVRHLQR